MKRKDVPSNVIQFPKSAERYHRKAFIELENKNHLRAKKLFEMVLQEPNPPREAYRGYLQCLLALKQYRQALSWYEKVRPLPELQEEETVELEVALYVEAGEYKKAQALIKKALQRNVIPPEEQDVYREIFQFCHTAGRNGSKRPAEERDVYRDLSSENIEKQWNAVLRLRRSCAPEANIALKNYLMKEDETSDPFLKSVILEILDERGGRETVSLRKFGKIYNVTTDGFKKHLSSPLVARTSRRIAEDFAQENPVLAQMAEHVWRQFVACLFPLGFVVECPDAWASAVIHYTRELNGELPQSEPARETQTNGDFAKAFRQLKAIETQSPIK